MWLLLSCEANYKSESFADPCRKYSKNIDRLQLFITKSNIFETFTTCLELGEGKSTPDLNILQICLAHWHLTPFKGARRASAGIFPISQLVTYCSHARFPLFVTDGVPRASTLNTKVVLHLLNFWRYYMVLQKDSALHNMLSMLDNSDKPRGWKRPIFDNSMGLRRLSGKWKGISGKHQHCDKVRIPC